MANNRTLNIKATGIISVAVMCSRLLGLVREVLFNALFGTTAMGVFLIAFRAPNLLRDLFAEGVLSVSFITVLSRKIEKEGDESAWFLASKMITLCAVFMGIISILGVFFAKKLIYVLAPGFSDQDTLVTILLSQIMYPFILLVSLAALVMGILNSKNVFGMPALASSFFNMASILGGVLCGWLIDPNFGMKSLIGLAVGTLLGGLFQLCVQIPSLKRVGFRFRPNFKWGDPGVRDILILTLPGIIAASAVQINVIINSGFASYIGKEAVTWLNSAFRLVQFPIGVLGVAVSTITLPVVSRIAAANDNVQFGLTIGKALRFVVFLTMPAAVGLYFFAKPIVQLIYEHGKFYANDTTETAFALQFYALGLVAYSCVKILAPGFYALNKKWTPMFVSFFTITINILLNYFLIFVFDMGHRGLALSTSISAIINVAILYFLMSRQYYLDSARFLSHLVRCSVSSVALAVFCWFFSEHFSSYIYDASLLVRGSLLFMGIFLAGLSYLVVGGMLRIEWASRLWWLAAKN